MPEIRRKNNPVWPGQNELTDLKRWVEKMQGLRNSACNVETHQKHGKDPLLWQKHLPECQEVIRILPHESWAKILWILACNSTHSRGSKGDDSRLVEESLVKSLRGHILHYSPTKPCKAAKASQAGMEDQNWSFVHFWLNHEPIHNEKNKTLTYHPTRTVSAISPGPTMMEICWSDDEGVDCPQPDHPTGKRDWEIHGWLENYLQLEVYSWEIHLQMVDYQRVFISITDWFQSISLVCSNSLPPG